MQPSRNVMLVPISTVSLMKVFSKDSFQVFLDVTCNRVLMEYLQIKFSRSFKIICAAIRLKAEEIREKINLNPEYKGKIPLYVTGHSLGAALASMFYFRLRKGRDLDDVCHVRDAYVFGCPGNGDSDFAMGYARFYPVD